MDLNRCNIEIISHGPEFPLSFEHKVAHVQHRKRLSCSLSWELYWFIFISHSTENHTDLTFAVKGWFNYRIIQISVIFLSCGSSFLKEKTSYMFRDIHLCWGLISSKISSSVCWLIDLLTEGLIYWMDGWMDGRTHPSDDPSSQPVWLTDWLMCFIFKQSLQAKGKTVGLMDRWMDQSKTFTNKLIRKEKTMMMISLTS